MNGKVLRDDPNASLTLIYLDRLTFKWRRVQKIYSKSDLINDYPELINL